MSAGCRLCPRACGIDRASGEAGLCGARDELRIAHVMIHHWEEPPISGEAGSGTIFFPGCSLRCAYCQNHAISRTGTGHVVSEEALADEFLRLQDAGAMNVNLVTPTHFAPQIRASVRLARARGLELPIIWNTSGYETVDAIRENAGCVDVYLTDLKYADARLAAELSGAPDYPDVAKAAIHEMVRVAGRPAFDDLKDTMRLVSGVVVRHLVLPGCVQQSCEALDLIHHEWGDAVLVSIMSQYTPQIASDDPILDRFPELVRKVSEEEYEAVLDHADALGIRDYFWQEGDAAEESFIPEF